MKPYEWMVKTTPQTEWIERRGILIWLAEVSNGIGGGLYLVSLYLNSLWGMFLSWLIVVLLKGGFHFAYLGKPIRFWRMALKPGTHGLQGFYFLNFIHCLWCHTTCLLLLAAGDSLGICIQGHRWFNDIFGGHQYWLCYELY